MRTINKEDYTGIDGLSTIELTQDNRGVTLYYNKDKDDILVNSISDQFMKSGFISIYRNIDNNIIIREGYNVYTEIAWDIFNNFRSNYLE